MMTNGLAMRIAESVGVPVSSVEPLPSGGVRVVARSHVTEEEAQKLLAAFEACALPGQTFEVVIGGEPMHKWTKRLAGAEPPTREYKAQRRALEIGRRRLEEEQAAEEHRQRVERVRGEEFRRLSEEFGAVVDGVLGRKA